MVSADTPVYFNAANSEIEVLHARDLNRPTESKTAFSAAILHKEGIFMQICRSLDVP